MAFGRKKAPRPTISPALVAKLDQITKRAPPHPKEAFYGWATMLYRFRRVSGELKDDLKAAARNVNRGGDPRLNWLIDKTAGDHVTAKMKWKYRVVLEKALKAKVPSKKLKNFIEGLGGINAGSSKSMIKKVPRKKVAKIVKLGGAGFGSAMSNRKLVKSSKGTPDDWL